MTGIESDSKRRGLEHLLVAYRQRIREDAGSFVTLYEEFIGELVGYEDDACPLSADTLLDFSPFFSECQRSYLALREQEEVRRILEVPVSGGDPLRTLFPCDFGKKAYERVQDLASFHDFSRCRRALMAGAGALPSTLFWLYDQYPEIESIGLDVDPACVALASRAVDRLGLDGVQLVEADAREFDYGGADFVFVANQVSPKRAVLERIAATADLGTSVVIRDPTPLGVLLAESASADLPGQFSIVSRGDASKAFLSLDVFLHLGGRAEGT